MDFTGKYEYTIPGTAIACIVVPITFGEAQEIATKKDGEGSGVAFILSHFREVDDPSRHLFREGDEKHLSPAQLKAMGEYLSMVSGTQEENGDSPRRFHGDGEGDGGKAAPDGDGVWSSPESTAEVAGE